MVIGLAYYLCEALLLITQNKRNLVPCVKALYYRNITYILHCPHAHTLSTLAYIHSHWDSLYQFSKKYRNKYDFAIAAATSNNATDAES